MNASELRKQVLELIDSMKDKKGAVSELGRAAETQDWGETPRSLEQIRGCQSYFFID